MLLLRRLKAEEDLTAAKDQGLEGLKLAGPTLELKVQVCSNGSGLF